MRRHGMAKTRSKFVLCLLLSVLLIFSAIVFHGIVPHLALAQRVRQLQSLNERLHENVGQLLASKVGGTVTAAGEEGKRGASEELGGTADLASAKISRCETIHIGFVAAGYNASRSVATVLKSILFYRHNPLHLHFVSDAPARHILSTLLLTWQLPAVSFSFYKSEALTTNVSWIPTFHYSGVYGLMKLTLPDILPTSVECIIMLDTDVMLNADIALLWQFFEAIRTQRKLFGIVENQSNWYLGNLWNERHPWPALGRGFNTGVVLLNLQTMRKSGWYRLWSTVARKIKSPTALADQDVVNAVIKEYPDTHYVLPCAWNVQLSDNALSEFCYQAAEDFKIIHWNSPKKAKVENAHGPYFRALYQTFIEYNGNLLRHELLSCKSNQGIEVVASEMHGPCQIFRKEAQIQHRTFLFFLGASYFPTSDNDVTLVSQLSIDRLSMLDPLCHHWAGPISLSVYASDVETLRLLDYYHSSSCLQKRHNVAIHIVYTDGQFYPVNYLRNVAIENVRTPYILLSDIDFLPMFELYGYLQEAARVLGSPMRAFIVPAFETHLYKFDFPANKTALLRMLDSQSLYTFRYHEWPKGHAPTNYAHWRTASTPYRVNWASDFEPYVMVSASNSLPKYDTRFVGFGWNKVSHIMELHHAGYEFVVLPNAFIIHMPHSPSLDISQFRSSSHYRDCLQVLKKEFQEDIRTKYNS